MLGRIHSVESFSLVDGPGIRYVIFMQGCNLRCRFCHNPDTWKRDAGKTISANELANEILKSKVYMQNSGGGVTISGGEPLIQIDFLIELCKILKKEKVHIAIDTAGYFETNIKGLDELLENIDLILFDIKHIDKYEHESLVGVENTKILNMAEYLSNEKNIPLWIRIVYIPGITDKNRALERYKKFITTLKSVQKVEVLPYHEMGVYKWDELGIEYSLKNIRIPTIEECRKIEKFLEV